MNNSGNSRSFFKVKYNRMKKTVTAFAFLAFLAACNSNSTKTEETRSPISQADTSRSNSFTDRQQVFQTEGIDNGIENNFGIVSDKGAKPDGSFSGNGKTARDDDYKS